MNTRFFSYFLTLCEEKSYARAAARLYLTPQGLNKTIRGLEDELGSPLIDREASVFALTPAGEAFLQYAAEADKAHRKMLRRLSEINSAKNSLRLGFSYGTIGALGINMPYDFQLSHPEIVVSSEEHPDLLCEKRLEEGAVDLAFTIAPVENPNFISEELKRERHYFWVHRDHPLSRYNRVDFEDIEHEKIAMIGQGFKTPIYFKRACQAAGKDIAPAFTTVEMSLLKQYAQENRAISLTVEHDVNYLMEDPRLRPLLFEPISWCICISHLKNAPLSPAAALFMDFAREYVKRYC